MREAIIIYENGEPSHFEGQFLVTVRTSFDLAALAALDPSIELIFDRPSMPFPDEIRHIFARADEEAVDGIVAALVGMPDVIEAGRNSIAIADAG